MHTMKILASMFCISVLCSTISSNSYNSYDVELDELSSKCFTFETKKSFLEHFLKNYANKSMSAIKRNQQVYDIFHNITKFLDFYNNENSYSRDPVLSSQLYEVLLEFNDEEFGTNIFNDVDIHTLSIIRNFEGQISLYCLEILSEFRFIKAGLETILIDVDVEGFSILCSITDRIDQLEELKVNCVKSRTNLDKVFLGLEDNSALNSYIAALTDNNDGVKFILPYLKNSYNIFIYVLDAMVNMLKIIENQKTNDTVIDSNKSEVEVSRLEHYLDLSCLNLTSSLLKFLVYNNRGFYIEFNQYFTNKLHLVISKEENLFSYDIKKYYAAVDSLDNSLRKKSLFYNSPRKINSNSGLLFNSVDHANQFIQSRDVPSNTHFTSFSPVIAKSISQQNPNNVQEYSQADNLITSDPSNLGNKIENFGLTQLNDEKNYTDNSSLQEQISSCQSSSNRMISHSREALLQSKEDVENLLPAKRSMNQSLIQTKCDQTSKRKK